MSGDSRAIRSICVAGSGIVGLSAALAFARALPQSRVSILETPADEAALADRPLGSLPAIHRFHAAIGLDELELVRSGAATHLLGTRFDHWSASGEPWFHAFGDHGIPAGDVPFHSVWLAAHARGQALAFHRHAPAAVLAAAGKFSHPSRDPNSPLANFLYGLRLDPLRYRERLERAAAPLPRERGSIADVERREDGGIASLLLEGGGRVEADLFLDCTGPAALLASRLDPAFEDWSEWLPFDRLAVRTEPAQQLVPFDRVTGTAAGWSLSAALPDRTMIVEAFSSAFADAAPTGERIAIRSGCRPSPWTANVLALGDAAVAVDPLHATNLHLAQSAILRALELLPGHDFHPLELREYNRRSEQEASAVRDFLALHYLRSGRRDSPFWSAMAERGPPATLHRTIEQFERRGRLPRFEEESFDKHSWTAALIGLGVIPQGVDPLAAGVNPDKASSAMASLAAQLEGHAERVLPYPDMLARMKAPSSR